MKEYVNKNFLGVYDSAGLLSLSGVVAASFAMILATQGSIELALVGLIFAGVADLFDGVVARSLQRNQFASEFGVQLDTTVDVIAFVTTPVVIGLNSGPISWFMVVGIACFVVAGVVRLAHFNTLAIFKQGPSTHHRGLPVTYTALIFPLLFLLWGSISGGAFSLLLGLSFTLVALLFVINIPVRKPHGLFYVILPLLAVVLIAYWCGRYLHAAGIF